MEQAARSPRAPSTSGDVARTWLSERAFQRVEHAIYIVLGVMLGATALIALFSAGASLLDAVRARGDAEAIIATIDHLLFVLMLLEIMHTVGVSIRSGTLTCEPFLIVGLIASIRRVLVITLSSSQAIHPGNWNDDTRAQFIASMLELGVLALMILVMVVAIYLLRRVNAARAST